MAKVILTKEGFDKLTLELKELKEVRRPKAIDTLQKARAMGDLSENSAYTAAREEQAIIEGRIQELEEMLKNVEIAYQNQQTGIVALGSTVTVEVNGQTQTFQIVGQYEADPVNGKLSETSPIGSGLLGKKVNTSVDIRIPAGKITYFIKNVR